MAAILDGRVCLSDSEQHVLVTVLDAIIDADDSVPASDVWHLLNAGERDELLYVWQILNEREEERRAA